MDYTQTIKTQRLTTTTGNKKEYVDYLENVGCFIQPMDSSFSQDNNNSFGKDKLMICGVMDIIESDRVVHGSDVYRVVGIERFDDVFGEEDHLEVLIRIFK